MIFAQPEDAAIDCYPETNRTSRVMHASSEFDPSRARSSKHERMSHRYLRWDGIRADHVSRSGLQRQETHIRSHRHVLLMNLQGQAKAGEDFINGRRIPFNARMPGALTFIPAETEWVGWDDGEASAAYVMVSMENAFSERALSRADGRGLGLLRPRIGFRDHVLEQALRGVLVELQRPDAMSETFVVSYAIRMSAQLLRLEDRERKGSATGLSPFHLARIIDMIESRIGPRPSLLEMAAEVHLDAAYFSRTFKLSTGMSPHAFVRQNRVQRAAGLLKSTEIPITQIALECGFSTPSHFAIAFRDAFAMTPTEYRRTWKILLR